MNSNFEIFDSLLEPCFIVDRELRVVYCNETALIVTGLSKRKVVKAKLSDVLIFSDPADWLNDVTTVTEAAPYKETLFKTQEGEEGKVQITCVPYDTSPSDPNWIVFVRDVTLEERLQKKYRAEFAQKENYILELQKAQKDLENYSKNLEKMVEERTAEIRELNTLMSGLLDSLSQGFFVFDREGRCLDFSSKACETVVESKPNTRPVWEVLKLPNKDVEGFKKWATTLFAEMLPFEDLAPLGPQSYPHSEGRHIHLDYFPLMSDAGMQGVITVATDITNLVEAQNEAEREREHAKMILNLVSRRQNLLRFTKDTEVLLEQLKRITSAEPKSWDPDDLFRVLHTLKGGFATFNALEATTATHDAETLLSELRHEFKPETAHALAAKAKEIAASYEKFLTQAKQIIGAQHFRPERTVELPLPELQSFYQALQASKDPVSLAESFYFRHALVPVGEFFKDYDGVARSLAEKLEKGLAPLTFEGESLPILPEVYSELFSTLIHVYRNAVDHGIEPMQDRLNKGKPAEGHIHTKFTRDGAVLRIEVVDDGGGIDPAKIRARLAKAGKDASPETDDQVIQHVFDPSFSTKEAVTEVSGRGVGMDAIKFAAEKLGGHCQVHSEKDKGTRLLIEVPWRQALNTPTAKAA